MDDLDAPLEWFDDLEHSLGSTRIIVSAAKATAITVCGVEMNVNSVSFYQVFGSFEVISC